MWHKTTADVKWNVAKNRSRVWRWTRGLGETGAVFILSWCWRNSKGWLVKCSWKQLDLFRLWWVYCKVAMIRSVWQQQQDQLDWITTWDTEQLVSCGNHICVKCSWLYHKSESLFTAMTHVTSCLKRVWKKWSWINRKAEMSKVRGFLLFLSPIQNYWQQVKHAKLLWPRF